MWVVAALVVVVLVALAAEVGISVAGVGKGAENDSNGLRFNPNAPAHVRPVRRQLGRGAQAGRRKTRSLVLARRTS